MCGYVIKTFSYTMWLRTAVVIHYIENYNTQPTCRCLCDNDVRATGIARLCDLFGLFDRGYRTIFARLFACGCCRRSRTTTGSFLGLGASEYSFFVRLGHGGD